MCHFEAKNDIQHHLYANIASCTCAIAVVVGALDRVDDTLL